MYAYIHPECGRPAFLMVDKPEPGKSFLSAKTLNLDHTPRDLSFGCTCDSCGRPMLGAGQIDQVVNYLEWKHKQTLLGDMAGVFRFMNRIGITQINEKSQKNRVETA